MQFKLHHRCLGHTAGVYDLIKISDKEFLSASGDRLVVSWNIDQPEQGNLIARASDSIYSICYLADKNELLIGQAKGEIHFIDLSNNQERRLLKVNEKGVFSIVENKSKSKVYVLGGDGVLSVLSSADYSLIFKQKISTMKLRSVFFDEELNKIFVGCGEGMFYVFDDDTMEVIYSNQLSKQGFSVNAIIHYTDDVLLCGGRDAHLRWVDKKDYTVVNAIPAHNYAIYKIGFSPDKKLFATASRDKTLKIWNANTNQVIQRIEHSNDGHLNSVNTLLWIDDNTLISAGDDRSINIWKKD
ncbi:MAG: WD40 repeat domain-containing protein [Bacteroidota bacterium]|jgi:WD40 repeat protein